MSGEELLKEVFSGNKEGIKRLLNSGVDVNYMGEMGQAPIHAAMQYGDIEDVKLLLQHGADVKLKDENGESPIHYAMWYKNVEYFKMLLDRGADINSKGNNGFTPLHYSALYDKIEFASFLVDKGADVNVKNDEGKRPIDLSYFRSNNSMNKFLLSSGSENVEHNHRNKHGDTKLHIAIKRYQLDNVKYLLDMGADINTKDGNGKTPLHIASSQMTNTDRYERESLVKFLLDRGADTNSRDDNGKTPLYYSSNYDLKTYYNFRNDPTSRSRTVIPDCNGLDVLDAMKLLVERGADINPIDNEGRTPLHYIVRNVCGDVITFLLEHGVDINIKDHEGKTPIYYAIEYGREDVCKLLLDSGAIVNYGDGIFGQHPIHLASSLYSPYIVKLLVDHGVYINYKDEDGQTPLHLAVMYGGDVLDILKVLLKGGADINSKNKKGQTPLKLAESMGFYYTSFEIENQEYQRQFLLSGIDIRKRLNDVKTEFRVAYEDMNKKNITQQDEIERLNMIKSKMESKLVMIDESLKEEILDNSRLLSEIDNLSDEVSILKKYKAGGKFSE